MSPEERQLLSALFERIETASATPRDRDAETLIGDEIRKQPYAPYYLAQAVIVQEQGLTAAAQRIQELEARVKELENASPRQETQSGGGGFLGSIFGSSERPRPAGGPWSGQQQSAGRTSEPAYGASGNGQAYSRSPQAMAAPSMTSGPWGGQNFGAQPQAPSAGGSFLRGALGTAAGVAGGMLLANSLSGLFSNHTSGLGWGSPAQEANTAAAPIEETTINNYYGDAGERQVANTSDDQAGLQQADYGNDDDNSDFGSDDFGGDDNLDI